MEFARLEDYPKYRIYINGDVIREYKNGKEKLLKPRLGTTGYYFVTLCNGVKQKHFKIHRLVAMLFIPNPDIKKEVDHINRVRTDNRLENLRWCCRSGQNLNRNFKDNNTGFPFISKSKNKSCKSGFEFSCDIRRNGNQVLHAGRAKLEGAIELVRQTLIDNMWVLDGYDMDKVNKIKEKYKLNENV